MLSAQLESSPTSRVIRTRPSHGKHIDPFTQERHQCFSSFLSRTRGGWYSVLQTEHPSHQIEIDTRNQ